MANKLVTCIEKILSQKPGTPFKATEIADLILQDESYIRMRKDFHKKSEQELRQQLIREIYSDNAAGYFSDNIHVTSDTPKLFSYILDSRDDVEDKDETFYEWDLYPLLCTYLHIMKNIYPKRINEKKYSSARIRGRNEWMNPDIVGLQVISEPWCKTTKDMVNSQKLFQTSLWSFEVKRKLDLSNVRKSFFQTVSNSSWANYAYLVAVDIDDKAMDELQILCRGHNIGVIQLNKESPLDSQIRIPAQDNLETDIDIMNKICCDNKDFADYVEKITEFYQTGKIKKSEWDC